MDIDTLILSGGSIKGISFMGSIKYLIENKYISENFKNIKKIICVSASFLFILMFILFEYNYDFIENEIYNYDFTNILNINDISLTNLVDNYGLINYSNIHLHIKELLKKKYNVNKMSMLKLYNISNIHIIVKVVNLSDQKIEYIDHINNPKINILKLLQMTTAIPILMKPIKYKNKLYLDGGLCGNCPNEINDSKNYLCLNIKSNKKYKINNIFDYLSIGWIMYDPNILTRKKTIRDIYLDLSELSINVTNFDIDYDLKKNLIDLGYKRTKEHFTLHLQR